MTQRQTGLKHGSAGEVASPETGCGTGCGGF